MRKAPPWILGAVISTAMLAGCAPMARTPASNGGSAGGGGGGNSSDRTRTDSAGNRAELDARSHALWRR